MIAASPPLVLISSTVPPPHAGDTSITDTPPPTAALPRHPPAAATTTVKTTASLAPPTPAVKARSRGSRHDVCVFPTVPADISELSHPRASMVSSLLHAFPTLLGVSLPTLASKAARLAGLVSEWPPWRQQIVRLPPQSLGRILAASHGALDRLSFVLQEYKPPVIEPTPPPVRDAGDAQPATSVISSRTGCLVKRKYRDRRRKDGEGASRAESVVVGKLGRPRKLLTKSATVKKVKLLSIITILTLSHTAFESRFPGFARYRVLNGQGAK